MTASPEFLAGEGTKEDCYVLRPRIADGSDGRVLSAETITITDLDPGTTVVVSDLDDKRNGGRFVKQELAVQDGRVQFQVQFDSMWSSGEQEAGNQHYEGKIQVFLGLGFASMTRLGTTTVY